MTLQQQVLVPWSSISSVASHFNDCQHKGHPFRPVERNINLRCSAKLGCDRLTYLHTSLTCHLSQRAANRGKPSIGSPDKNGNIKLRKTECSLRDGYENASRNKRVKDARNVRQTVARNQKNNRVYWQNLLNGLRSEVKADTRSRESGKYTSDDKINTKDTDRPLQSKTNAPQTLRGTKSWIQFLGLLDPSPENLLVLLLVMLLVLTTGQTLFELFVVSASIVVTAVQYAAIAAMLLGILVALL